MLFGSKLLECGFLLPVHAWDRPSVLFRVRIALGLRKKESALPKPFVMSYFRQQWLKREQSCEPTTSSGSDRGGLYGATGLRVAMRRQ
jgi:hypothetical protein